MRERRTDGRTDRQTYRELRACVGTAWEHARRCEGGEGGKGEREGGGDKLERAGGIMESGEDIIERGGDRIEKGVLWLSQGATHSYRSSKTATVAVST